VFKLSVVHALKLYRQTLMVLCKLTVKGNQVCVIANASAQQLVQE